MKKIIVGLLFLVISTSSFSQYKLQEGQTQLNTGVGFSNWGIPVYIGFDYGVHRNISLGVEFSYRNNYNSNHVNYKQQTIAINPNGNFHFTGLLGIPEEFDIYLGLTPGFWFRSNGVTGIKSNGFSIGGQVGGRWYFTDNLGVNFELGGGSMFDGGKIGITYIF